MAAATVNVTSECSETSALSEEDAALSTDDVEQMRQFDYVRFTVTDVHGIGRCKVVPRRHIEQFAHRGVDITAGILIMGHRSHEIPLDEIVQVGHGNARARPQPRTIRPLPWVTQNRFKVGEVLCETFWTPPFRGGMPQAACPRYMARHQLKLLDSLGYSLLSSFEAEFVAMHKDSVVPVTTGDDFCVALDLAMFEPYLYDMDEHLAAAGVDTENLETESGAGQFEFALKPMLGIDAADCIIRLKQGIKEMSPQRDYHATFMTVPDNKDSKMDNALHFNHSLWSEDGATNAFHDSADKDGLSVVARHWLAGLCKHAPALAALCMPTVNCYRRLRVPFTPVHADWGVDDRFAAFRIKRLSARETYVENRLPGGSANPYLVLAGTVAAGMSGIKEKLECPPPRPKEQVKRREALRTPGNLGEALDALERDEVLVEALGREFVTWFVRIKREIEIEMLKDRSIEEERNLYCKFL